jgi:hypothetical protein
MATKLARTDEAPEPVDISGGLLAVIATAARDPNVDVDKMERLLEMQERVYARQAKTAYDAALAELQPQLPVISEKGEILNKNGGVQSTYALWEDINDAIRPLLSDHGFALSFKTGRHGDQVAVTGILSHKAGHREETTLELPSDGSGSKNAVQSIGSSVQYGKRYTASALLNITTRGDDDDGQSATKYQGNGEPMARAKLAGPHPSKTALRNAVNSLIAEIRQAKTGDEISAIVKRNKDTTDQAKRDWPTLLDGDPKIPEDIGLRGALAEQRALVAEDGALSIMIASMKQCDTKRSLANWMDTNEEAVAALDGAEARRFQTEFDAHEAGIDLVETVRA